MEPKITIGIPTYNRSSALRRAIASALLQEGDVEVIISDNASGDDTRDVCEHFASNDRRVRYFRQPQNIGAEANFNAVRLLARGKYFMWLGDDDWIEPGYVQKCAALLDSSPEHVLVAGLARYYANDQEESEREDVPLVLEDESPRARVLAYFESVLWNGVFYGLHRRRLLDSIQITPHFGSDWSLIAALAFLGKVRTLHEVHVNRSIGSNSTPAGLNALYGISGYFAEPRNHAARLAYEMWLQIARQQDVFRTLSVVERNSLALAAAHAVITNKYGSLTALLKNRVAVRRRVVSGLRLLGKMAGAR